MAPRDREGRGWARGGQRRGTFGVARGRGGRRGPDQGVRHSFRQTQTCRFGPTCRYSHDSTSGEHNGSTRQQELRPQETPEQHQARADYNAWKRLIKDPPRSNDNSNIERLWKGALAILNSDERDKKQALPRDLDDEDNFGRAHIRTLLSMQSYSGGDKTFIEL